MIPDKCTSKEVGYAQLLTDTEFEKLTEVDLRYEIPFIVTFNRNKNMVRLYSPQNCTYKCLYYIQTNPYPCFHYNFVLAKFLKF